MRIRQARKIRNRAATSKNKPYRMSTFRKAMRCLNLRINKLMGPPRKLWVPGEYEIKEHSWMQKPADWDAIIRGVDWAAEGSESFTAFSAVTSPLTTITKKDLEEDAEYLQDHREFLDAASKKINDEFWRSLLETSQTSVLSGNENEHDLRTTESVGSTDDILKGLLKRFETTDPIVTHMLFMTSAYQKLKDQIEVRPHIDRGWNVIDSVYGIAVEVFDDCVELRKRAWLLRQDGAVVKIFED